MKRFAQQPRTSRIIVNGHLCLSISVLPPFRCTSYATRSTCVEQMRQKKISIGYSVADRRGRAMVEPEDDYEELDLAWEFHMFHAELCLIFAWKDQLATPVATPNVKGVKRKNVACERALPQAILYQMHWLGYRRHFELEVCTAPSKFTFIPDSVRYAKCFQEELQACQVRDEARMNAIASKAARDVDARPSTGSATCLSWGTQAAGPDRMFEGFSHRLRISHLGLAVPPHIQP